MGVALKEFNVNQLLLAASQEFDKCLNDLDQFLLTTSQAYDKEYDEENASVPVAETMHYN